MSNSPRTSRPRYQKIRELGHKREGGRVTYLAKDNATGQPVVMQFQFAQSGSDWAGFKAYEREIQILHSLNHPGIPAISMPLKPQKVSAWCRSTKRLSLSRCRASGRLRKSSK